MERAITDEETYSTGRMPDKAPLTRIFAADLGSLKKE
jgi:hypothetical protein